MGRLTRVAFILVGLGLAVAGLGLVWQNLGSARDVRLGVAIRNGDRQPTIEEVRAAAERLAAIPEARRSGDEAGALTFLDYWLAEEATQRGDAAAAERYAARAEASARQTLRVAPTRADAALALALLRYRGGGDGDTVQRPLLLSYQTAPRELWIIERRIDLALRVAETARPELLEGIKRDIRTLGEPGHDPVYYLELARAAYAGGPYATALARRELTAVSARSLQVFNQDLEALGRPAPR